VRIGNRRLGDRSAPYIIAEIGVNHDGKVKRARELVEAAASAGAHAVKFQYFEAQRLLSRAACLAKYQNDAGARDPFEMLAELELSVPDLVTLVEFARARGLDSIVTLFSLEHVDHLRRLPWAAYKVASPDIVNRPLIDSLRECGRSMILSTGASTAEEVMNAVRWMGDSEFALMHCISAYPTPDAAAQLAGIAALQALSNAPIGYSDHTTNEMTGGLAVAAGAAILEKHLTHSRAARGPDHAMSLEPDQFQRYVAFAHAAANMLGESGKILHPIEQDVRTVARQSVVAARPLRAGHRLVRQDLTLKRPGKGLECTMLTRLIGCTLRCNVDSDTVLTQEHVQLESNASAAHSGAVKAMAV
jgi:sialic acid synthase SpsE